MIRWTDEAMPVAPIGRNSMADSDYKIHVNAEAPYTADTQAIHDAALQTLTVTEAKAPAALTIVITSDERIRELNAKYAGLDEPTDVLSFAAESDPYAVDTDEPPYLGDVIIAFPVAERQAQDVQHSVIAELQTLTIHGVLHLLGYDHATPDDQARMWALQSAALNALRQGGKG
jgi:probable rRNA maturation factor